jgi:murein DD-endopeptidase MepM/ murein hydrolase activator NlpD
MNIRHSGALALRWIVALSVGIGIMAELIKSAPQGIADDQVAVTAAADPWSGASFPLENFSRYTSPLGSYIRSWWEGKVIDVHDHTACGTAVIIQSGRWTHIYCHMQGHLVVEKEGGRVIVDRPGGIEIRLGQKVTSGQRIGRVGMTGSTTGPHLHWGLKYDGAWVDPAIVIKAGADYQLQASQAVD